MRIHNTLTRQLDDIIPLSNGEIRMYTCGPTVYRFVHLGNLRTFLLADLVRRSLEFEGYEVTQVMNITDVGHMTDESSEEAVDKMLLASEDEGLGPLEIAEKYTKAFHEDAAAIGIQDAKVYPKATEHIPEMLEMTQVLIDKGHAYEAGGTVYYDVASFREYGKLSGNTLDKLRPGHRDLETDPNKKHHADFSLWKAAGPGRLMKWDSPWGEGFPGWHIECSAMSVKYLGDRFDIHTGGVDLIFPHHEDEIAQSEGATGHQVINAWVHGGHLRLKGQKIAKSSGNVVRVEELVKRGIDPLSYRYLTFQTRYRSEMDFSWEAMEAADHKVKQVRRRMAGWKDAPRPSDAAGSGSGYDKRFREAVSRDLDIPAALVVLHETVSSEISDGDKYALLASWDRVLGLDLERDALEAWEPGEDVQTLVAERDAARDARNFAKADEIREKLQDIGLEVMDTPAGTKVRPRRV
ncbi:MAG: cysteine--tRNA ligase [Actinomycetota bacterium]